MSQSKRKNIFSFFNVIPVFSRQISKWFSCWITENVAVFIWISLIFSMYLFFYMYHHFRLYFFYFVLVINDCRNIAFRILFCSSLFSLPFSSFLSVLNFVIVVVLHLIDFVFIKRIDFYVICLVQKCSNSPVYGREVEKKKKSERLFL